MTLNPEQQLAYSEIVTNKAPIVYLTGSAGTGKTFTISQIIKHFHQNQVLLTASTHKAKTVLSQMTQRHAYTVHSAFGFRLTNIDYKQVLVQNENHRMSHHQLVILDEISMCPDKVLQFVLAQVGKSISQLLIVGDEAQLPAVSNKPNLKALAPYQIKLTQQMRQSSCPLLATYMQNFRDAIFNKELPSLATDAPAIKLVDNHREFCREYLRCSTQKKIIAYRNNVVDKYNANLTGGEDIFNIGDTVILDKPLGGLAKNQDQVKITAVQEDEDKYTLMVCTDEGSLAEIMQYKSSTQLTKELTAFKQMDNPTGYWNLFSNTFRLKHVYASTVHKAQGETIQTVFVDALDIINAFQIPKSRYNNPISQDQFLRLMFVAISRMAEACYIFTGNDTGTRHYDELTKDPDRKIRKIKKKQAVETPQQVAHLKPGEFKL